MVKWEYLEAYFQSDVNYDRAMFDEQKQRGWLKRIEITDYLNQLGQQGWELVSRQDSVYTFKRPIA